MLACCKVSLTCKEPFSKLCANKMNASTCVNFKGLVPKHFSNRLFAKFVSNKIRLFCLPKSCEQFMSFVRIFCVNCRGTHILILHTESCRVTYYELCNIIWSYSEFIHILLLFFAHMYTLNFKEIGSLRIRNFEKAGRV